MTDFNITKKEAVDNLVQKAKEFADKGNLIGVAQCKAQIDVIRSNNTEPKNNDATINIES